jgi:hypothetical protein
MSKIVQIYDPLAPGGVGLDWSLYYDGHDPKTEGPKAWYLEHGAVENFPCPTCRRAGTNFLRCVHDIVNVHLNKKPKYPALFPEFVSIVNETASKIQPKKIKMPKIRHIDEELKPLNRTLAPELTMSH